VLALVLVLALELALAVLLLLVLLLLPRRVQMASPWKPTAHSDCVGVGRGVCRVSYRRPSDGKAMMKTVPCENVFTQPSDEIEHIDIDMSVLYSRLQYYTSIEDLTCSVPAGRRVRWDTATR
jgi:hypothetical protein